VRVLIFIKFKAQFSVIRCNQVQLDRRFHAETSHR